MDAQSKLQIERLAEHYPDVVLVVIGEAWFKANKRLSNEIPHWETLTPKRERPTDDNETT